MTIPQSMTFSDSDAASPVFSSNLSIASLIVVAISRMGLACTHRRVSLEQRGCLSLWDIHEKRDSDCACCTPSLALRGFVGVAVRTMETSEEERVAKEG